MGTTYNASVELDFVKRHVCCGCDAEYQYHIHRKVTGSGGTQAAAEASLEVAAVKALANEVDQHPCPHCGLLQPDMLASRRGGLFVGAGVIAGAAAITGLIMAGPDLTRISTSAIFASLGVVLGLLLALKAAFTNPNTNMIQLQEESQRKVDEGIVELISEGSHTDSTDRFGGLAGGHIVGLAVLGIAALGCVTPLVLPVVSGWTMNDAYPAVVGSGDTTRVYFRQKIRSLDGMWNGMASANIVEGEQIGISARTKQDSIGNEIDGDTSTRQMYVDLTFPEGDYAGRKFRIDLNVDATFPEARGGDAFVMANGNFRHTTDLKLSGGGAGTTYRNAWVGGQVFAIIAAIIAVVALNKANSALAAQANPTEVVNTDGEEEPTDGAEEYEEYEDEEYEDEGYDDAEYDQYDEYEEE